MNKKLKHGWLVTLIFSVISLLYLYPIILVVINSFKKKAYISRVPFELPRDNMFVGLENYIRGIEQTKFFEALAGVCLSPWAELQSLSCAVPCVHGLSAG